MDHPARNHSCNGWPCFSQRHSEVPNSHAPLPSIVTPDARTTIASYVTPGSSVMSDVTSSTARPTISFADSSATVTDVGQNSRHKQTFDGSHQFIDGISYGRTGGMNSLLLSISQMEIPRSLCISQPVFCFLAHCRIPCLEVKSLHEHHIQTHCEKPDDNSQGRG